MVNLMDHQLDYPILNDDYVFLLILMALVKVSKVYILMQLQLTVML